MPKWGKPPSWEEIPFDRNATPEQKAKEFDAQFEESKIAGEGKQEFPLPGDEVGD